MVRRGYQGRAARRRGGRTLVLSPFHPGPPARPEILEHVDRQRHVHRELPASRLHLGEVEELSKFLLTFALGLDPPYREGRAERLGEVFHLFLARPLHVRDHRDVVGGVHVHVHPAHDLPDPIGERLLIRGQHLREIVRRQHAEHVAVRLVVLQDRSLLRVGRLQPIDRVLHRLRGVRHAAPQEHVAPHRDDAPGLLVLVDHALLAVRALLPLRFVEARALERALHHEEALARHGDALHVLQRIDAEPLLQAVEAQAVAGRRAPAGSRARSS
jgi:hypothetical protein